MWDSWRRSQSCRRLRRCSAASCSGRPTGLLFDHVPLSCVPPWTSAGFDGLIATLINCNVFEVPVDVRDQVWHSRKHATTVRQAVLLRADAPLVGVTSEREVAEITIRPDHPAVRALEDLGRI